MHLKRWLVWLMKKTKWRKPKYSGESKIPFIPTEKQLDILIAALGKKRLRSASF
jgi:hypothetical protein